MSLLLPFCVLWFGFSASVLAAQRPEPISAAAVPVVPPDVIDDATLLLRIEAACEVLRLKGELRTVASVRAAADGRTVAFASPPLRPEPLPLPRLRDLLLQSTVLVGVYYHCEECSGWHASASTGFAVARDGLVATCCHVLADDAEQQDSPAYAFVAGYDGQVFAVTECVAADASSDLAVLRCSASNLVPLPLRPGAMAGEPVYCLSNPDHLFATFTAGTIARRYLVRGPAPGPARPDGTAVPESAAEAGGVGDRHQALAAVGSDRGRVFLQVTCEFASGSSGAPVVDACGNVVGIAQSTASVAVDPEAEVLEIQMVVRTAVPTDALLQLRSR